MSSRPIFLSPTSGVTSFASHWVFAHRECSRLPSGVVSLTSFRNTTCVLTHFLQSDSKYRPRSNCFGPLELGHALFLQHCPSCFHNRSILPFRYAVLSRCISPTTFASNSHLLQIIVQFAEKAPPHLPLCFPFNKSFFRFWKELKTSLFFSMR